MSGSKNLVSVLNVGHQVLTGVFPKSKSAKITSGPFYYAARYYLINREVSELRRSALKGIHQFDNFLVE